MRVLIVGGGGREHALAWKVKNSTRCSQIFCAPGNGGISEVADCVDINATDIPNMVKFAQQNSIDMTIVGPDDPLALGMVDAFEAEGLKVFGPRKKAAIIEASKMFAKNLMQKHKIPTAEYRIFSDFSLARAYVKEAKYPTVVKADGLALGKGVVIVNNYEEACDALDSMMNKKMFGKAGENVVIEQFVEGEEVSVLAFTDGKTIIPMVSAKDHKKIYDGNTGSNTGGMGVFSPCKSYKSHIADKVFDQIITPSINAMNSEGRTFCGVLYFGLMLTQSGPLVLEFNARFGDPETQAIIPLLKTDLLDIFDAVVAQDLANIKIEWRDKASVCVVLASGGYPGEFKRGLEISGVSDSVFEEDVLIFHSGTKKVEGKYYTNGGRVLGVTALDSDVDRASAKAYINLKKIHFENMHFRKDIGKQF